MTAEEFAAKHGGDYVELIDGVVVRINRSDFRQGVICVRVARHVGGFVVDHNLGVACCNDTFVLVSRNPDRVRGADFCFWARDRIPAGRLPDVIEAPPELVVEVRPPSDTWETAIGTVVEYLRAGVKVVILLDPDTATASVYRPDEAQQVLTTGDNLTVPDVLPGFSVPVRRFFE